ncbi:hypothetical protein JTE90_010530 [Oedothorax gibbosus]|uniref:Uncharacterized protein n=1 Tax=Oedothorax gibbosus TaxID=931172 RepID=A0AAV6TCQ0_9ARAC|nr:hypothetical protein JTE90_010530 [Oedothorax gibbosus]
MLQPKSEGHRSSILNHNNSAKNIQQGTFPPNISKHILPNSQIHHGSPADLGKKISKDQQKPHSVQDGQGHTSQRLKYTKGHYASTPFIRQDILGDTIRFQAAYLTEPTTGNNSKIDLLLQYENSGEPDFLSIYRSSSDTDFLLTSGNSSEPNLYERFGQPDFY